MKLRHIYIYPTPLFVLQSLSMGRNALTKIILDVEQRDSTSANGYFASQDRSKIQKAAGFPERKIGRKKR